MAFSIPELGGRELDPQLLEEFEIEGRIGASTATVAVYQAVRHADGRQAAVKIWISELDALDWEGVHRELRLHDVVKDHESIVTVLDSGTPARYPPWLALDRYTQSLAKRLASGRPLSEADFEQYAADLLAGLAHVHRHSIVHRDVNPTNVLLKDGRAVLCDFGLAIEEGMRAADRASGTPGYVAPELMDNNSDAQPDFRADVFSAATTLKFMLTGRPDSLGPRRTELLFRAASVVEDRPENATAFRQRFLATKPAAASASFPDPGPGPGLGPAPEPGPERVPDTSPVPSAAPTPADRRGRARGALAAVTALAAISAVAIGVYITHRPDGSGDPRGAGRSRGPASTGPASTGPASTGPASTGPASTGPASTGPASTGPASTGPASTGPASTGPDASVPLGQMPTGDLPGYHAEFADDFTTDVPTGSWPMNPAWYAYPDGTATASDGKRGEYLPSAVMSQHDGWLDFTVHSKDGRPVGAVVQPGALDQDGHIARQRYGRYSIRFKATATAGFYAAFWLYPGEGQLERDGAIYLARGNLDGPVYTYVEKAGGEQSLAASGFTDWHVATLEWSPQNLTVLMDGKPVSIITDPRHIPSLEDEVLLQIEPTQSGPPTAQTRGHVLVDWISIQGLDQ